MRSWYVLRTRPHAEEQVDRVLTAKGIRVFLPRLKARKVRVSGEGRWAVEPLFPGYLFARFDVDTEDWLVARSAPGVTYVLGQNTGGYRSPAAIPESLVEHISRRLDDENGRRWDRNFKGGDRIRILAGPFRSLEAVFDRRLSPSGRVQVLLATLGRIVPVQVHMDDLQRLL